MRSGKSLMVLAVVGMLAIQQGQALADPDHDAAKNTGIVGGTTAGALIGTGLGLVTGPLGAAVGGIVGGAVGATLAIRGNRAFDRAIRDGRGSKRDDCICPTPDPCC